MVLAVLLQPVLNFKAVLVVTVLQQAATVVEVMVLLVAVVLVVEEAAGTEAAVVVITVAEAEVPGVLELELVLLYPPELMISMWVKVVKVCVVILLVGLHPIHHERPTQDKIQFGRLQESTKR